jgi:hypothetical protein
MLSQPLLNQFFGQDFSPLLSQWLQQGYLDLKVDNIDLTSDRFLNRSIIPHLFSLSDLFNRIRNPKKPEYGFSSYWSDAKSPAHVRLAYFLGFNPGNAARMAHVFFELQRLGFIFPEQLKTLDFGAAQGAASLGLLLFLALTKKNHPVHLALLDQDRTSLKIALDWLQFVASHLQTPCEIKTFHKQVKLEKSLLPVKAPRFNLWMMSFVLNELMDSMKTQAPLQELARTLCHTWDRHLQDDGLVILVEPALIEQSRKLYELRKCLLAHPDFQRDYQVLTPCLGNQACGALDKPDDWCFEEVSLSRPPYLQRIDELCGLNHAHLSFSYLVIMKSRKSVLEILPRLQPLRARVVSTVQKTGPDLQCYLCTQEGKKSCRIAKTKTQMLARGSVVLGAQLRGAPEATRVDEVKEVL